MEVEYVTACEVAKNQFGSRNSYRILAYKDRVVSYQVVATTMEQ
jgi:hypothetical protein